MYINNLGEFTRYQPKVGEFWDGKSLSESVQNVPANASLVLFLIVLGILIVCGFLLCLIYFIYKFIAKKIATERYPLAKQTIVSYESFGEQITAWCQSTAIHEICNFCHSSFEYS